MVTAPTPLMIPVVALPTPLVSMIQVAQVGTYMAAPEEAMIQAI